MLTLKEFFFNFSLWVSNNVTGVKEMTYTKPELDIKKFDILEEIMADGASAIGGNNKPTEAIPDYTSAAGPDDGNLIIG